MPKFYQDLIALLTEKSTINHPLPLTYVQSASSAYLMVMISYHYCDNLQMREIRNLLCHYKDFEMDHVIDFQSFIDFFLETIKGTVQNKKPIGSLNYNQPLEKRAACVKELLAELQILIQKDQENSFEENLAILFTLLHLGEQFLEYDKDFKVSRKISIEQLIPDIAQLSLNDRFAVLPYFRHTIAHYFDDDEYASHDLLHLENSVAQFIKTLNFLFPDLLKAHEFIVNNQVFPLTTEQLTEQLHAIIQESIRIKKTNQDQLALSQFLEKNPSYSHLLGKEPDVLYQEILMATNQHENLNFLHSPLFTTYFLMYCFRKLVDPENAFYFFYFLSQLNEANYLYCLSFFRENMMPYVKSNSICRYLFSALSFPIDHSLSISASQLDSFYQKIPQLSKVLRIYNHSFFLRLVANTPVNFDIKSSDIKYAHKMLLSCLLKMVNLYTKLDKEFDEQSLWVRLITYSQKNELLNFAAIEVLKKNLEISEKDKQQILNMVFSENTNVILIGEKIEHRNPINFTVFKALLEQYPFLILERNSSGLNGLQNYCAELNGEEPVFPSENVLQKLQYLIEKTPEPEQPCYLTVQVRRNPRLMKETIKLKLSAFNFLLQIKVEIYYLTYLKTRFNSLEGSQSKIHMVTKEIALINLADIGIDPFILTLFRKIKLSAGILSSPSCRDLYKERLLEEQNSCIESLEHRVEELLNQSVNLLERPSVS